MILHKLNDALRFKNIVVARRRLIVAILYIHKLNTRIRFTFIAAWECDKFILVDFLIGKSNQMFMFAPIMPKQSAIRENVGRLLKDRVIYFVIVAFVIIIVFAAVTCTCGKEVCRRQLLCIACNHNLLCSENGADCILRENLRSLVEDDHIELICIGIQEIGNGQR